MSPKCRLQHTKLMRFNAFLWSMSANALWFHQMYEKNVLTHEHFGDWWHIYTHISNLFLMISSTSHELNILRYQSVLDIFSFILFLHCSVLASIHLFIPLFNEFELLAPTPNEHHQWIVFNSSVACQACWHSFRRFRFQEFDYVYHAYMSYSG